MATPYAGEETFHATITTIDGTDEQTAESVSVPLRELADRTAWLEANSGGGGGGGGGLTKFAEGESTDPPNDTIPVVSLTAIGAGADVDAALVPKGEGALLAAVPDGTTQHGNKRGTRAVDWQTSREDSSQVASGRKSVLAGGDGNTVSGEMAACGGGGFNDADGFASCVPGGMAASTRGVAGQFAFASFGTFDFTWKGQAQMGVLVTRRVTTSGASTPLTVDGGQVEAGNISTLADNSAVRFRAEVVGFEPATGDVYSATVTATMVRGAGAGTTAMVASSETTGIRYTPGAATWSLAVNTNLEVGGFAINATGEAGKTIRWVATIYTTEVTA